MFRGSTGQCLTILAMLAFTASSKALDIAQWDFDLPVGVNIGDAFASDTDVINGLVANASTTAPTYGDPAPALAGSTASLRLTGGSFARVTDADILTGHDQFANGYASLSIDVWIKLASNSTTTQIVRKTGLAGSNTPGIELYAQTNGLLGHGIHDASGLPANVTATSVLTVDTWHHVQTYWDGANLIVAVDGDEKINTPYSTTIVNTDIDMGIGALIRSNGTTGQYFDGWIDGLKLGTDSPFVVAYHPGDANGDGLVNLSDLQILGDNWQSTTATWAEADFTGDGTVNLADLQILGDNWGFGTTPDAAFDDALEGIVIPEPTGLALLGAAGLLALRRRG
ncbi:MAG: hypothetical protein IT445_14125 [Phycisphaeraceae bacterium]|nr:hypothetical protein [Phycisphaeraceae bacterium]